MSEELYIQIGRRARMLGHEWDWESSESEGLSGVISVRDRGSKVWSVMTVGEYLGQEADRED